MQVVAVSGINRAPIRGSFLVSVFGNVGGEKLHLGTEAVLSRWNVQYCANCQTHLEVKAFFGVPPTGVGVMADVTEAQLADATTCEVQIQTRDGRQTEPPPSAVAAGEGPLLRAAHHRSTALRCDSSTGTGSPASLNTDGGEPARLWLRSPWASFGACWFPSAVSMPAAWVEQGLGGQVSRLIARLHIEEGDVGRDVAVAQGRTGNPA